MKKTKKDVSASPEKGKSLESALSQIETQFGPGTIMRMGEKDVQRIPSISTGSLGSVSYTHLTLPTTPYV